MTNRTGLNSAIFAELFADGGGVGFFPATLEIGNHAFERVALDGATTVFI